MDLDENKGILAVHVHHTLTTYQFCNQLIIKIGRILLLRLVFRRAKKRFAQFSYYKTPVFFASAYKYVTCH